MSKSIEESNNERIIKCGIDEQESDANSLKKRRTEI